MPVTTNFDGSTGVFAVYTGNDDAPMTDPLGNITRVKEHSSLDHTGIILQANGKPYRSGTASLAKRAGNTTGRTTVKLFSHGRPGVPLVEVYIQVSGQWIALNCSVPIQRVQGLCRWITAGADDTNVYINEYWAAMYGKPYADISVPWRCIVTDERVA